MYSICDPVYTCSSDIVKVSSDLKQQKKKKTTYLPTQSDING